LKALTLTQPWASLVAVGAKRWETRSWSTTYRGPLAIHAAKGFPGWAREFAEEAQIKCRHLPGALPLGAIVATCRLADVIHTDKGAPTDVEDLFGDWSPGRYAWLLEDVAPLAQPVLARGALGLWEWEPPR